MSTSASAVPIIFFTVVIAINGELEGRSFMSFEDACAEADTLKKAGLRLGLDFVLADAVHGPFQISPRIRFRQAPGVIFGGWDAVPRPVADHRITRATT